MMVPRKRRPPSFSPLYVSVLLCVALFKLPLMVHSLSLISFFNLFFPSILCVLLFSYRAWLPSSHSHSRPIIDAFIYELLFHYLFYFLVVVAVVLLCNLFRYCIHDEPERVRAIPSDRSMLSSYIRSKCIKASSLPHFRLVSRASIAMRLGKNQSGDLWPRNQKKKSPITRRRCGGAPLASVR